MFTITSWSHDSVRLRVATAADHGPPLLLLHGVLRSWTDFAPLWPALTPRWHLHALDLRGHGGSSRHASDYLVRDYAADVVAFVRARLPLNVVLYGHSLGAHVAVAVAAELPERIQGVILEDPPAPSFLANVRATPYFAMWSAMQSLAGSSHPVAELTRALADIRIPTARGEARLGDLRDVASLRYSARCLRDVAPEVLTPLLAGRWLEGYDVDALWSAVSCPVLMLRGDESLGGMLGRAEAEALVRRMPDGALLDVPGAGHLLHWAATETTVRLCLGFLESLR